MAPYSEEAAKTRSVNRLGKPRRRVQPDPTIVFVHGYALNLDCWHFQRAYFRGKHRLVFYDQRSHGRSGRSDKAHATIDQLGDDLRQVIDELVPEGPVVLVGHSMGGMSIMAFAEQHRELFDERVVGVALMSTTAGGLKPHHIVSRLIPDSIGGQVGLPGDRRPGPRAPARGLAAAPRLEHRLPGRRAVRVRRGRARLVRRVRRTTCWPPRRSRCSRSSSRTSTPSTSTARSRRSSASRPTSSRGTKDVLTSVGHSRKMAQRIPGSRLVECVGAGHMVILEQKDRVNQPSTSCSRPSPRAGTARSRDALASSRPPPRTPAPSRSGWRPCCAPVTC